MPRGIPKNKKVVPPDHALEKGNPEWNLKGVTPTDVLTAPGAVTKEDMDLERELERMAMEQVMPDIEPDLVKPLTKEKREDNHLRDHVTGYKPAETLNQLEHQAIVAKNLGADIDATPQIFKHFCGANYKPTSFMYKDVRVNLPDTFDANMAQSRVTLEQHLFGKSKVN